MMYIEVNGRLGADAELKTSTKGNQFVSLRVATNDYIGGENITTWVNVLWSGDRAVKMAGHVKKGSSVVVRGVPKFSTYTTKNGENAVSVDVFADRVDFGSNGNSGVTQANDAVTETGKLTPKPTAKAAAPAVTQEVVENNGDDDLPF